MNVRRLLISVVAVLGFFLPMAAFATTGTIDSTYHTARLCANVDGNGDCHLYSLVNWNVQNWIGAPAYVSTDPVSVTDSGLSGYIFSDNAGWIKLGPASPAPTVPGCTASHVEMSPANSGVLTGCGWGGDSGGWTNFLPTFGGSPPAGDHGVEIDPTTGEFSGYAWISGAGWMDFDCTKINACVKTSWRPTPTLCTDSTANNFGGPLPCTYSNGIVITTPPPPRCTDTTALNFGGPLPCEYAAVSCTDPSATNYGGALPCTYTALCEDSSATNYHDPGPCEYAALTCADPSATNFGDPLPCTYAAALCEDSSATNYESTAPCTYATTTICNDSTAANYHSPGACVYGTHICVDSSAKNFGSALPCTYSTSVRTTCTDPLASNYRALGSCLYSVVSTVVSTASGTSGCTPSTATDPLGVITGSAKNSYCQTKQRVSSTAQKIKAVFTTKTGDIVTETVTTVGVVAGSAVTVSTALFLNPISFSELFLIPARLWAFFLSVFGLRKRRRPWGTVYDSVTKQPLDPAYVTLRDIDGKEIISNITDLDGRFGFVVPQPGVYSLFAQKTNYVFPSQKLVGHDHDELYRDLYFGEHFTVAEAGAVVIKNIPMDPEKFDWNEFAKREQNLMRFYSKRDKWLRRIADIFFGFGFVISSIVVLAAPKSYNIVIFLLYVLLYFIRVHGVHSRPYGYLSEAATNIPVSFGIIRISSAATGVEVMHRIADAKGRYYALLPNGGYKIRVDRKLPDGTYKTIASDMPATVTKGYLAKTFLL